MPELVGVIPIAVTPFDEHGGVDEESIATLVEFEARCGVHGLNVLGIMGEAHKLSEPERQRVAEVFLKPNTIRAPGSSLDDVTRAELRETMARMGVIPR